MLLFLITLFLITRVILQRLKLKPLFVSSSLDERFDFSKYEPGDIPLDNYTYYCNIWKYNIRKTLDLIDELKQDPRFKDIKYQIKYGAIDKLYLKGTSNDLIHVFHNYLIKKDYVDDLKLSKFYYPGVFNLVHHKEPELFTRGETLEIYEDNEVEDIDKIELTKIRIGKVLTTNYETTYRYRPTYYSIRFITFNRDILEVKFEDYIKFNYLGNFYNQKPDFYILNKLINTIKLELDSDS
jgi:hypothetical protein